MPTSAARADLSPEALEKLAAANMAPVDRELDATDLPIRGKIPHGLDGTLYRNGPNPQFPPGPQSHWFFGDGMLHRFEISGGRVSYRNRWIRTPRFEAEREAGHALPRNAPLNTTSPVHGGTGNTNILWYNGKLLALEEAHLPIDIDPVTLETRDSDDWNGILNAPFTAHPRIDPQTNEIIFFGYAAQGPFDSVMTYGRANPGGVVTHYERFRAPYAAMVHDFIVTKNHVLFPIMPLASNQDRVMAGGPLFAWDPALGAWFGVMPRNGPVSQIRWVRGDARFAYHVMNAWDDGAVLYADVMEFPQPALFPNADGSPVDPTRTRARLTRWSLDLAAQTDDLRSTPLDDLTGEFPRIDDRFATLAYRHGWYVCTGPGRARGLDSIAHIDHATGRRKELVLPLGDVPSEPVFVPASATAPEGDGWILSVVWRGPENRSELVVLDAQDISAGPIASVELPQRVPFGFHGNFVSTN